MKYLIDSLLGKDTIADKLLKYADRLTDERAERFFLTEAWIKAVEYTYAHQLWMQYLGAVCYCFWSMQDCGSKDIRRQAS